MASPIGTAGFPRHIVITRLSAIGDCVATLPVVAAIKSASPDTTVTWCVSCAAHQLLSICPDVDNVVRVSKQWVREPGEWSRLRQFFRKYPVDCVIDPQSLLKSSLLGRLSGAPLRIGFARPLGRELSPWLNTECVDGRNGHVVDIQLRLLKPLGIADPSAQFRLDIDSHITDWATEVIERQTGVTEPVIMNVGAGWPSKLWPAERYAQSAAWVKAEFGLPTLIVWAGDDEHNLAREVAAMSNGAATVAPDSSLIELAALVARAKVFVSSDTGPMHIAVAMGARCLSLHGPTLPELSGPYGDHHRSIRKVTVDGPLPRGGDDSAMRKIAVQDVCEKIGVMLSTSETARVA